MTLVEVMVAGTILGSVLMTLSIWMLSSLRSCALANAMGQSHVAVLATQDTLSRDVQQAAQPVGEIELDGRRYATRVHGDGLVLRLPAVDAQGSAITDVFDFVAWSVEPSAGSSALVRRLFVNRDHAGRPLTVSPGSVRLSETRTALRGLADPAARGPLFSLDREVAEVSREVAMCVVLQGREPQSQRTVGQRYATRLRMRND
jgi:hypothetical protein